MPAHKKKEIWKRLELLKIGEERKIHFIDPAKIPWVRWQHSATLCLFELQNFQVTVGSVALKLRIKREEVQSILQDLVSADFIHETHHAFTLNTKHLEGLIFSGVTPDMVKAMNTDMMEKAKEAMAEAPHQRAANGYEYSCPLAKETFWNLKI